MRWAPPTPRRRGETFKMGWDDAFQYRIEIILWGTKGQRSLNLEVKWNVPCPYLFIRWRLGLGLANQLLLHRFFHFGGAIQRCNKAREWTRECLGLWLVSCEPLPCFACLNCYLLAEPVLRPSYYCDYKFFFSFSLQSDRPCCLQFKTMATGSTSHWAVTVPGCQRLSHCLPGDCHTSSDLVCSHALGDSCIKSCREQGHSPLSFSKLWFNVHKIKCPGSKGSGHDSRISYTVARHTAQH